MRIGGLSERTGVDRRLLRYYEKQGLLHPVRSGKESNRTTLDAVIASGSTP